MGIRFRKSVKVAPGVRLNVGKKGVGVSVGGKGIRVSKSSRGTTFSAGIPGSGLYYQKNLSSKSKTTSKTNYQQIQKEIQKQQQFEKASEIVKKYELLIASLTTVHEKVSDPIDWEKISLSKPPFDLNNEDGPNVREIKKKVEAFKPTWRDKFFNRVEAKKKLLLTDLDKAKQEDEKIYYAWKNKKELADEVLNKNIDSWKKVISDVKPFEDIENLGSKVQYNFSSSERVTVTLEILNRTVVPTNVYSLTKTGKLSERKMAKGKYLQLYQDYVSSCTLKIAREFFNLLPLNEVLVNVYDESLSEEGKYGCILSVLFQRNEFESLSFSNIDCSDTIEKFNHNMKFLKTKGFKFVEELEV